MDKLSSTLESYLDAIYQLSSDCSGVRLIDIAKMMSVTKSTANAAMISLAQKGLINNERYRRIQLTDAGRQDAELLTSKHTIIRLFFSNVLQIDEQTADRDACQIEHVISEKAVRAMRKMMVE